MTYALAKLVNVQRICPGPVLFARLELRQERDPARPRPSIAKAELDCNGRLVRAHVAASTPREAADLLDLRLRQSVERIAHHDLDARLRHRDGESWHHGDAPTRRPAYFPRATEECEVVVRKSFALEAQSVDEAVADLEMLDHDFFLFRDVTNEVDCVVRRAADGYEIHCAGTAPDEPIAAPVRHNPEPRADPRARGRRGAPRRVGGVVRVLRRRRRAARSGALPSLRRPLRPHRRGRRRRPRRHPGPRGTVADRAQRGGRDDEQRRVRVELRPRSATVRRRRPSRRRLRSSRRRCGAGWNAARSGGARRRPVHTAPGSRQLRRGRERHGPRASRCPRRDHEASRITLVPCARRRRTRSAISR